MCMPIITDIESGYRFAAFYYNADEKQYALNNIRQRLRNVFGDRYVSELVIIDRAN